jgi:pyruvate dehydrogenase E2 component (dihydrolipoamide acetyltransferase)
MREVSVPDIGDFKDVEVIEVLVKAGDSIAAEQSLITVESDKATMEIPAPGAGVVKEMRVKVGDKVSQGTPILILDEAEATGAAPAKAEPAKTEPAKPEPATEAAQPEPAKPEPAKPGPEKPAAAPRAAPGGPMTVKVPDIGEFKDVAVIEVLVKPGDAVSAEQSLITVESDKATMEIPSPSAGTVKSLKLKVGDKVSEGSPILELEAEDAAEAPEPKPSAAEKAEEAAAQAAPQAVPLQRPPVPPEPREAVQAKPHASPSVRKFARELGVDLARVKGSGAKGRILHADVQAFVKGALAAVPAGAPAAKGGALPFNLPAWPEVDFAKFGPVEAKPLTRLQKLSGPNLHRNWISIPHVTQFDEADITELEAFRKANAADTEKQGFKLTMLAFLIKACVTALRQHPMFNCEPGSHGREPGGEEVLQHRRRGGHARGAGGAGGARRRPQGRVRRGERALRDLEGGARQEASPGRHAGRHVLHFQPRRHRRHGVHADHQRARGGDPRRIAAVLRPVWNGKEFAPRLMLPLALAYDHRVIDGAAGARFTSYLASVLADIRRSLL